MVVVVEEGENFGLSLGLDGHGQSCGCGCGFRLWDVHQRMSSAWAGGEEGREERGAWDCGCGGTGASRKGKGSPLRARLDDTVTIAPFSIVAVHRQCLRCSNHESQTRPRPASCNVATTAQAQLTVNFQVPWEIFELTQSRTNDASIINSVCASIEALRCSVTLYEVTTLLVLDKFVRNGRGDGGGLCGMRCRTDRRIQSRTSSCSPICVFFKARVQFYCLSLRLPVFLQFQLHSTPSIKLFIPNSNSNSNFETAAHVR